jgi:hypothetical protein
MANVMDYNSVRYIIHMAANTTNEAWDDSPSLSNVH